MKYLFILGRNPELSVMEIVSYFKRVGNPVLDWTLNGNAILAEFKKEVREIEIEKLGGVIGIGEVISSGKSCGLVKDLEKKEIYFGEGNKLNYVLWNFSESYEDVRDYLKKRFREEKVRACEKKPGELMKLQDGKTILSLSSKKLIDEEYFIFLDENFGVDYFGKIFAKPDYKKLEERDVGKPVKRESLAISPRLAKVMINVSEVPQEGKVVDAFCGIGVVLQEALLQGLNVIGVDKDKDAIKGAKENLIWAGFNENSYRLFNEDSSRVKIPKCDVFVSEPDFGDILRKTPNKKIAEKMLKDFENLMIKVLKNLKPQVSGRFVFTSPCIRISKERLSCDFERISEETKLNLVKGFPIQEFRENQIVGREIVVLER